MSFWIVAAFLTLLTCVVLLVPLARRRDDAADEAGSDLAVYQDQFIELDRDVARGAINEKEAAEARAEIGRRILKSARESEAAGLAARNGRAGRIIATLVVLAVPLASWGIYAAIGSPHLPAQPLSARLSGNPAENTVQELIARAERHLAANPEDGRGWEVVAPIYQRLGDYERASIAWQQVIRLLGSTAAREVAHGEAVASAAGGAITQEAKAAFGRALALEPQNINARFLLAAALVQEGHNDEAIAALRAILPDVPAGSPWQERIAKVVLDLENGRQAGSPDATSGGLNFSEEQAEMIGQMVSSLDARLREDPDDAAGWQQLVRSYVVLRKSAEATDALARGIAALGGDSEAAAGLQQFAAELGVQVPDDTVKE